MQLRHGGRKRLSTSGALIHRLLAVPGSGVDADYALSVRATD
jgi:hypothetical protein